MSRFGIFFKLHRLRLVLLVLLATLYPHLLLLRYEAHASQPSGTLNDTARFLAGLKPIENGAIAGLTTNPAWQQHAQALGLEWDRFASRSWRNIRSWSASELAGIGNPSSAVIYPFSGPDFVYVYNYFPRANAYLLCGLEPVGEVPDPGRMDASSLLSLRNSLHTLLSAGYFVTKTMRLELQGTLPLMLIMLARSGCTITQLDRIPGGVDLHFIPMGGGGERRLIYVTADLAGDSFRRGPFAAQINQFNAKHAFIKSASFLLHQNRFSGMRSYLLNQCTLIVQDDSGIPVRYFSPEKWVLRLYGSYSPPLNIFSQYYQPDLSELYAHTPTKALGFGVGYRWNPREATLIVASAK